MDKYQCLKLIRCQVFPPNCQKVTWGHHGGHLMPPQCPPCYFFLRTKVIFPIKCSFFSKNKNNMGGIMCPPSWEASGGIRHYPPFVHHPQNPSPTHHQTPTHSTIPTPNPPMEKMWGLNALYFMGSST